MHIGSTFITYTQPATLVQPSERALDHPARLAKMASMFGQTLADLWPNATLSQDTPLRLTVVTAVGLNALRFAQRSSRRPAIGGRPSSNGMSWVES